MLSTAGGKSASSKGSAASSSSSGISSGSTSSPSSPSSGTNSPSSAASTSSSTSSTISMASSSSTFISSPASVTGNNLIAIMLLSDRPPIDCHMAVQSTGDSASGEALKSLKLLITVSSASGIDTPQNQPSRVAATSA